MAKRQPSISSVSGRVDPQVRKALEELREAVQIFQGNRGNELDRALTLRDLESSRGVLRLGIQSTFANQPPDNRPVPNVTGFEARVGLTSIMLLWDTPSDANYVETRIYRVETDEFGNVGGNPPGFDELYYIGNAYGGQYADTGLPTDGRHYRYWARHYGTNGRVGALSSTEGLLVELEATPDFLLRELTAEITQDQFAASLSTEIDKIPLLETGLAQAETDIANAQTDIANAQTDIANAQIDISNAQTDIANAQTDIADAQSEINSLNTTVSTHGSQIQTLETESDDYAQKFTALGTYDSGTNSFSTIASLQTTTSTNATDISSLTTRTDTAESNITTLQSTTATNTSNISSLTTRVGDAESNITTLQTTTATQATQIANLTTSVGDNSSEITTLQTTTATNASDISSLTTRTDTAESNITSLQTTTSTNASDISSLTTRTDTAESNITTLQSTTATNTSSINSLTTRTDTAESNITTLQSTTATNTSNISSLTTRVGDAESNITTLQSTTATNATNISNLTTTVGDNSSEITTLQSTTATQATQISNLTTSVGDNTSSISTLETTTANQATSITQLNSGLAAAETRITTTENDIDGIQAEYSVKVEADGKVAGFGLIAGATDGTRIYLSADRIAFLNDSTDAISTAGTNIPFVVEDNVTYIDDARIRKLSASRLTGGNAVIDDLTVVTEIVTPYGWVTDNHLESEFLRTLVRRDPNAVVTGGSLSTAKSLIVGSYTLGTYPSGGIENHISLSVGGNKTTFKTGTPTAPTVTVRVRETVSGTWIPIDGANTTKTFTGIVIDETDGEPGAPPLWTVYISGKLTASFTPNDGDNATYELHITDVGGEGLANGFVSLAASEPNQSSDGVTVYLDWDEVEQKPFSTIGSGLTVSSDALAVDSSVVRTSGNQNIYGNKTFFNGTTFNGDVDFDAANNQFRLNKDNLGRSSLFFYNQGNISWDVRHDSDDSLGFRFRAGGYSNFYIENASIIAGAGNSTQGGLALQGEYNGANKLLNIGSMYSSGNTMIGYAVRSSNTTSNTFLSTASNSNFRRGALVIGDELTFYNAPAQTTAIDSVVSMNVGFKIDSSYNAFFYNDINVEHTAPNIFLKDTNGTNTTMSAVIGFKDNTNLTLGYVGYGSTSSNTLHLRNNHGEVSQVFAKSKVQLATDNGYLDINPQPAGWMRFETDRSQFYFNVGLQVAGSVTANNFSGNGSGLTNVNALTLAGVGQSGYARNNARTDGYVWVRRDTSSGAAFYVTAQGTADIARFYQGAGDGSQVAYIGNDGKISTTAGFYGDGSNLSGITAAQVGLGNVPNIDWRDYGLGTNGYTLGGNLDDASDTRLFCHIDSNPLGWNSSFGSYPMGIHWQRSASVEAQLMIGYSGEMVYRAKTGSTTWQALREVATTNHNQTITGTKTYTADNLHNGREIFSHSDGLEIPYGTSGGYGDTNGTGNDWGAPIWSMGDAYNGSGSGTNFGVSGSQYGLVWLRQNHPSVSGLASEGLHIYRAGTLVGAIGIGGSEFLSELKISGSNTKLTADGVRADFVQVGLGSGSVSLTTNDGAGNANVTFNHKDGVPDQSGSSCRIETSVDSTTGRMSFEVGNSVSSGVAVNLTEILRLETSGATFYTDVYADDFVLSSDKRLKSAIKRIKFTDELLDQIHGYTFRKNNKDYREAGYIAQEIQEVLPEAVYVGDDGYLKVSNSAVTGLLIEAAKYERQKRKEMEAKYYELEDRIRDIERKVMV